MDESVVEGSEDTSDAEDHFTCGFKLARNIVWEMFLVRTFADLRAEGDVLRGGAFDLLLGRHVGCLGLYNVEGKNELVVDEVNQGFEILPAQFWRCGQGSCLALIKIMPRPKLCRISKLEPQLFAKLIFTFYR